MENCWEYFNCGREPGGQNSKTQRVCPATIDRQLHGINRGINGGRFCWKVAGTFCNSVIQRSFAEKLTSCIECEFFQKVRREEKQEFTFLVHNEPCRASDIKGH